MVLSNTDIVSESFLYIGFEPTKTPVTAFLVLVIKITAVGELCHRVQPCFRSWCLCRR